MPQVESLLKMMDSLRVYRALATEQGTSISILYALKSSRDSVLVEYQRQLRAKDGQLSAYQFMVSDVTGKFVAADHQVSVLGTQLVRTRRGVRWAILGGLTLSVGTLIYGLMH
jgi:hypothetical protein